MHKLFQGIAGLEPQDASGVRGVADGQPVRLTRILDGASMLLHEILPDHLTYLAHAKFAAAPPDFTAPFVTTFAGILSYYGKSFLAEPLPHAVPLVDVWVHTLQHHPASAAGIVAACKRQLDQALSVLHARGGRHGAVCARNVVLTESGIYGLLQACVHTPDGYLSLRPSSNSSASTPFLHQTTESAQVILDELQTLAEGSVEFNQNNRHTDRFRRGTHTTRAP